MNLDDLQGAIRQVRDNPRGALPLLLALVLVAGLSTLYLSFCSEKGRQWAFEPTSSDTSTAQAPLQGSSNPDTPGEAAGKSQDTAPTIQQTTTGTGNVAIVGDRNVVEIWEPKPMQSRKQVIDDTTEVESLEPILEASYDIELLGLPIVIAPHSRISLILIRKDRKVEISNFGNNNASDRLWPTADSRFSGESVGKVKLANHDNANVFNVSYSIILRLADEKNHVDMTSTETQTIDLPLFDLPVGQSRSFGIVNQSRFAAGITLSIDLRII